jgi:ribosomal protein S18 acetylase RimI-like enzyme
MRWFDIVEREVLDQLQAMEREVLVPAGRRWFVGSKADGIDSLAALLVLEDVGYLDHVVTFPESRRRGLAGALACHAVAAARAAGAERTYLLADPDGAATRLYEGIGFFPVTQIASWLSDPATPGR